MSNTEKMSSRFAFAFVNMPEVKEKLYTETASNSGTSAVYTLQEICTKYDINKDPFIVHLRAEDTPRSQSMLDKCLMNNKTRCIHRLKLFTTLAKEYYKN
jgi:hypothetical protein